MENWSIFFSMRTWIALLYLVSMQGRATDLRRADTLPVYPERSRGVPSLRPACWRERTVCSRQRPACWRQRPACRHPVRVVTK
jgi:hypothetical protein